MSRYGYTYCFAAPLFGNELVLCKLLLDFFGVDVGLIHLIDCNDNLDTGSLCVVDSLDSLRHNTVVCGNNENCDISCLCTTSTH